MRLASHINRLGCNRKIQVKGETWIILSYTALNYLTVADPPHLVVIACICANASVTRIASIASIASIINIINIISNILSHVDYAFIIQCRLATIRLASYLTATAFISPI